MTNCSLSEASRVTLLAGLIALTPLVFGAYVTPAQAQAPAATPAARQLGTVKTIAGSTVTIATDAGKTVTVTVADGAKIVQLEPGSTDLKSAQTITLTDIAGGDRVLVLGKAGDTDGTLTATRVILMKSTAIAQKHASEEQDWQQNGISGVVTAADATSITVTARTKKIVVQTSPSTIFRRYAGDSVKFADARPGTPDQIHPGDQLSVRGVKSADGTSIAAEEIVSGSFRNLSGLIATIDAASGTITLKDLVTNKPVKIVVTANSDLRHLPDQMATMFAARAKGEAGGQRPAGAGAAGAGPAGGYGAGGGAGYAGGGRPAGAGGPGGPGGPGSGRSAGMDLSRMLSRLPAETIASLKAGEAVMIVASTGQGNSFTAVTMLSGVEPILSATPNGEPLTLSPWSMGAPDAGGGQ